MSKYVLWDKKSQVIVPTGQIFSKEEWLDKYPVAKLDGVELVINGSSKINGAFCNEYTSFIAAYKDMGCDFTGCETKEDYLKRVEEFEITANKQNKNFISPEERIASALEFQNAMQGFCTENTIKLNYEKGLWNTKMLEACIEKGIITKDKFKEITE